MQATTKKEVRKVKAAVRRVLEDHPHTRGDDDALYYQVCKDHARQAGVDLHQLHFTTVFLGNPFGFPKYESVVRFRRMEQRANPALLDPVTAANRKKKEADMVELARKRGIIQ